ncbi:hypothetical protein [Plantactinospora sp. KBS50]|uniref:hypothetical protein n=1 Tax=Plantactinospora sp. KBS50 TaxID=2024580 RepID=UPI0018DF358B|nr:hypothetical protein [Plantactinospora sp. KBS50]
MTGDHPAVRLCAALVTGALVAPLPGVASGRAAAAAAARAAAAERVCQVRDSRLNEISGMVATEHGFVVVNDSADDEPRRRIFFLDDACAVTRTVRYPSRPRDTEDLGIGADGTIWVADTGDNNRSRQTVAVWTLAPGGNRPVLHRMTYPDGAHDAEALLLTADGPLIVTKQPGPAGLYAPAAPLVAGGTVPLAKLGEVSLPDTTTSNPYSIFGRSLVTGGATAPDGRRVVLRTYADAFEFDVVDGDVVAALTGGKPRIVPLPDEPQGESISYSRDGRWLLTVSETADQPPGTRPTILRYPAPSPAGAGTTAPATAGAGPPTAAASGPAGASDPAAGGSPAARRGWAGPATPVLVAGAAIALAGIALLAVGLVLSIRSRRRDRA